MHFQVDPCSEHKCRRGSICVANSNAKEGYSCRCKIGTRGKYCEQGEESQTPSNPITGIFLCFLLIKFMSFIANKIVKTQQTNKPHIKLTKNKCRVWCFVDFSGGGDGDDKIVNSLHLSLLSQCFCFCFFSHIYL